MTMFDEAQAISGMMEMKKMTQSEIADTLGTSQSYVANKLRLLKLSDEARKKILEYGLSERHARGLLRIKNNDAILETIEKIHEMRLSVAASDALIDCTLEEEAPKTIFTSSKFLGIERFEKILRDSVKTLSLIGVGVNLRESFSDGKRYITLAIDDG